MLKELPLRMHHHAYAVKDQEANRHFIEGILGIPLVATWCERTFRPEVGREVDYCHTFFEIADGGALAFFQFAEEEDQAQFGPEMPFSPFHHIALNVDPETQKAIEARIEKAGYEPPQTFVLEHGYCRSVYIRDPNGMIVEFTCDDPRAALGEADRKAKAHDELKRWLAGDRSTNNDFRHAEAA